MLLAMQERLAGDPYVALGVAPTATAAEIRTAFLELTKTYHPARFGYMSPEVQKLSNEVFLSLRAAHDWIIRPARAAAAARADRSGSYPAARGDRGSGAFPAVIAARSDRSGAFPAVVAARSDRSGVFPAVAAARSDRSGVFP
ncbi:MAG TPA: J domain-containing protein, partial [Kofleriaceae bacterium]|nr:J domain-containing protein [Kofleriaceae bacterium]